MSRSILSVVHSSHHISHLSLARGKTQRRVRAKRKKKNQLELIVVQFRCTLSTTWKLNETCKSVGRIIFTSLIDYVVYLSAPPAMHHLFCSAAMLSLYSSNKAASLRRCCCLMIITSEARECNDLIFLFSSPPLCIHSLTESSWNANLFTALCAHADGRGSDDIFSGKMWWD